MGSMNFNCNFVAIMLQIRKDWKIFTYPKNRRSHSPSLALLKKSDKCPGVDAASSVPPSPYTSCTE